MNRIADLLEQVEALIYVLIGILLAAVAIVILMHSVYAFAVHVGEGNVPAAVVSLLEELLLGLMAVELLYTVIVSLRTHSLSAEPFLIVGLVAAIRRILTISVEAAHLFAKDLEQFKMALYEIGLLTGAVLVLVFAIFIMRKARRGDPCQGEAPI